MTRPGRTLALAGLLTILLTLFGANGASAEDRPPERSTSLATQSHVVSDHGSDTRPQDNRAAPLATCYGGQRHWDAGYWDDGYFYSVPGGDYADDPHDDIGPSGPVWVTSANCQDINIRLAHYPGPVDAQACLPTLGFCTPFQTISGDDWHVLRYNVPDGTPYWVNFDGVARPFARQTGYVAD